MFTTKHSKEGKAWDAKSKQLTNNKHPENYGGSGRPGQASGNGTYPASRDNQAKDYKKGF